MTVQKAIPDGARGATLLALPDVMELPVEVGPLGQPTYSWPNRLLPPAAALDRLQRRSHPVWWPHSPGTPPPARPDWAVNLLADADFYASGLAWHDDWLGTAVPVFNHPRAVAQCRRDLSAQRMQGIPGLVAPPCVRFVADGVDAFARVFERFGFRFPVLVRPSGGQSGMGLMRIDGPDGWRAACNTRWFGQPHFMTQFEDCATASGLYLKARVVFVGGQPFLRHVKAATNWLVHNQGPDRVADTDELGVIDRLEVDGLFMALCAEVGRRTQLDFCGLDLGVDPDRQRYVLFECNPAMSVFFPLKSGQTSAQIARRNRLQAPAERAMTELLPDPSRWIATRGLDPALPSVRTALEQPVAT